MEKKITMKVSKNSFRKLLDPISGEPDKYFFYVKVDNVKEGIPMDTNPRDQKLNSSVAKAIIDSLEENDGKFHKKNRGIVLSAGKVYFNSKRDEVTLFFDDSSDHGNIDGGHTYRIVCEHIGMNLNQFVQFEVMVSVEDIIEELAEARNTSVQVDVKSMAELANKFDPIKEGIEGMPFYERIAFKQNQITKDLESGKNQKMIDAREVVAIVSMFNIEKYSSSTSPTQSYSSKAKMLEDYLTDPDFFRKFVNIMPDIFDLYDCIEREFAEAYIEGGGRYGRKKYSGYIDGKVIGKSKFGQREIFYKIPDGIIYPAVAAFRALLEYDNKKEIYVWKNGLEPIDVWEEHKIDLTTKIMNFASSIGDNPNAVGKDSNIWDLAYMTIMLAAANK